MTYTRCWGVVWAVLTAAVLGPAIVFWSPGAVIAMFVFAALLSASVVVALSSPTAGRAPAHWRPGWPRILGLALMGGLGAVAAISVAQLSVAAAILLVLVAAGSAPATLRRVGPLLRRHRAAQPPNKGPVEASPSPPDLPANPPALSAISDAQLCDTWRRSLSALHEARDVGARLLAVHLRAACLDEMERRNPGGIRRWLDSGPSGSPDRYLAKRGPGPTPGQSPGQASSGGAAEQPPAEPDAA